MGAEEQEEEEEEQEEPQQQEEGICSVRACGGERGGRPHAIPCEYGEIGALNDEAAFEEDSRQQRHDGRHGQVPQYQAHPLFDCRRLR